jgi:hypothetical protein
MSLFKLLGSIVAIIIVMSSLGFYLNIMDSSVRMANGDPSASDDFGNAVADEVVGTVQWGLGVYILIVIAGALGLTGVVAWLKKYAD